MSSIAEHNKALLFVEPRQSHVGDGWRMFCSEGICSMCTMVDSEGQEWEWDLDDYDPAINRIKLARLSRWVTNRQRHHPHIDITRDLVNLDFATMRVKNIDRLIGIERYNLELAQEVFQGSKSPLDPEVTRQKIPELWQGDWESVLSNYATNMMTKLETGNLDPATVSQHEKLYIGWRVDRVGDTTFAAFEKFVADNIDFGLERPRRRAPIYDKNILLPFSTTAEEEFPRIGRLEQIWSNKQQLIKYIKSGAAGSFALEGTTGSHGDMITSSFDSYDSPRIAKWTWKLSDYNPITSVVATVIYKTGIFNDIVHTNFVLSPRSLWFEEGFTPTEKRKLRFGEIAHRAATSRQSRSEDWAKYPFSATSLELKMGSFFKPAVWEDILDKFYSIPLRQIEAGDIMSIWYTPEQRRYIGWRYRRSLAREDTTWSAYPGGIEEDPAWANWTHTGYWRNRKHHPSWSDGPHNAKARKLDARIIYI
jgi:hypothetical protein